MTTTKTPKNFKKSQEVENDIIVKIISDLHTQILAQLNALMSFLSTAYLKINKEEKELIELTLNSCKAMQNYTDVFLMAYRANFEKIFLEYEKFDFIGLIKEVIDDFEILLKYCNLELELKMPSSLKLAADKNKLKKTLQNLILCNINTAFKGSKITIKITNKNTHLEFQIVTNSKYVEPFIVNEIFKKNKKYNSQYSQPLISLGLFMISQIVYAHFGTIYAKSYSNNINIFGFSLPLNI